MMSRRTGTGHPRAWTHLPGPPGRRWLVNYQPAGLGLWSYTEPRANVSAA